MHNYGLDFTSSPSRRKPITCACCELYDTVLTVKSCFKMTSFRASRPFGDKLYLRLTDQLAGAISPMMLHRVPVGKMFFQGADPPV